MTAKEYMERWSNGWCNVKLEPNNEIQKSLKWSGADDHTTCRVVSSEEEEEEEKLYSVTKSSNREELKQSAKIYKYK
jgi:hypothetical protein